MIKETTLEKALAKIKQILLYEQDDPPDLPDDESSVLTVLASLLYEGTLASEEEIDSFLGELNDWMLESGLIEGYSEVRDEL